MEIDDELERLYNFNQWSDISEVEILETYSKVINEKSTTNRGSLKHEIHPYVTDNPTEENHYEFYPSVDKSKRLMIYVHGGYWYKGCLSESVFLANLFVERNCNFVSVGYDLCPNVTVDTIVHQVRRALKSIIVRYPDIDEIFLCGHSVGAHLSLMSLVYDQFDEKDEELHLSPSEREKLKRLVLISGIYDVRPVCRTSVNEQLKLSVEDAWRLSPSRCCGGLAQYQSHLKVLIMIAEFESPACIEQTTDLRDALSKLLPVKYVFVNDKNHFDVVHDLGDDGYAATELLMEFLGL